MSDNTNNSTSRADSPIRVEYRDGQEPFVMAIDLGSSSVRTAVYDSKARTIEDFSVQVEYEATTESDGTSTYDPASVLEAANSCIDGTTKAADRAGIPISAVGFSCYWHSLVGIDENGQPVTPVLHLSDTRSADQADALRQSLEQSQWRARTGTVFHSSYWPAKLKWLKEVQPYPIDQVATWFSIGDLLFKAWTGETLTSLSMASGTGLCELESGNWCAELIERIGADIEVFPRIVDRDHSASLGDEYCKRWPSLAKTRWTPALGDGACANIGSGANDPNSVAMTLGTTGAVRVAQPGPLGSPCKLYDNLWAYRLDGATLLHGSAITNGGLWFDWTRSHFSTSNNSILEEALESEPGKHGLTILPFVSGERAPIWNDHARAAIVGLSTSTSNLDIVRASIESVALRMSVIYNDVAAVANHPHRVVANGAALLRSDGIMQMVSDSIDHDLLALPAELEASARGAAVLVLDVLGISGEDVLNPADHARVITPGERNTAIYRKELDRQQMLLELLYPKGRPWNDVEKENSPHD